MTQPENRKAHEAEFFGIGVEIYFCKGQKLNASNMNKAELIGNNSGEGYMMEREVSGELTLQAKKDPYTILVSTFNPYEYSEFWFTL